MKARPAKRSARSGWVIAAAVVALVGALLLKPSPAAGQAVAVSAPVPGDVQRGKTQYEARCGGCHSVAADRIGPRHAGLMGRKAGSVEGFAYSAALKKAGFVWDAALLERWLRDPEALVPGQRMGYRLGDEQARADVIAYLATLGAAAK